MSRTKNHQPETMHPTSLPFLTAILILVAAPALPAQNHPPPSREGHPADHLPAHIRELTGFGERPDWSHDGEKILFVGKTFGDVYEVEVDTGFIRPLTLHYKHYGYTRALYLANGHILLAGPNRPFDLADSDARREARHHCRLSVLDPASNQPPVPLGVLCSEGPAVSRHRMKIAWAELWRQNPERLEEGQSVIWTADVVYGDDGSPRLADQRLVFDSRVMPFAMHSLETQNFVPPDDSKITMAVYVIKGLPNTETYVLDLETGAYANMSQRPDWYNEPEGIFPDGRHTTVEAAPSRGKNWPLIDIYKLALDGSAAMERMTHFTDFHGFKASQGIISDDGAMMCFQIGKTADEAGAGYGLFLFDLKAWEASKP